MMISRTHAAAALPDPEIIRETARDVFARPEYQLEPPSESTKWLMAAFENFLVWLGDWIRWLFQGAFDISPILGVSLILVLVLIAVALIAHIVYTFKTALENRPLKGAAWAAKQREVDPSGLERQAGILADGGDFIGAVRLVFRACIVRLERMETRAFRVGLTNRELLRRYQNTSLFDPLKLLVDTIDAKWYGHEPCGVRDYEQSLHAQQVVRQHVKERPDAHNT